MKAAAVEWIRAQHQDQVFELLEEYGDEARVLAGGQTLLATLNMRLSEPAVLIDINGLEGLGRIEACDGYLRIGALVTHAQIEESALVAKRVPLLSQAAPHIAHRAIRNRGTWGGSLAYADPAAEWCACVLALDATIVAAGRRGQRRIAARDFFVDLYATALDPGEIVIAADVPVHGEDDVWGFQELARRHGDYAIAGLAARARRSGEHFEAVRLAYLGVGVKPFRARATEAVLEGHPLDDALLDHAALTLREELSGALEPVADLTNSVAMKRHLAQTLLRRAFTGFAQTRGRTQ